MSSAYPPIELSYLILIRQKGPLRLASPLKTGPGAPALITSELQLSGYYQIKAASLTESWRLSGGRREKEEDEEEVGFEEKRQLWVRGGENGIDKIIPGKKRAFDFVVIFSDRKTKEKGAAS